MRRDKYICLYLLHELIPSYGREKDPSSRSSKYRFYPLSHPSSQQVGMNCGLTPDAAICMRRQKLRLLPELVEDSEVIERTQDTYMCIILRNINNRDFSRI